MSSSPPPSALSIYGPRRLRLTVKGKGGDVDILKTYSDLFEEVESADKSSKFHCLICLRRLTIIGKENELKALSMSSSANIVAHFARCAPEELTAEHAALDIYKKPASAWLSKQTDSSAPSSGPMAAFLAQPPFDIALEIALLCLSDMRPFYMVEGKGFTKFLSVVAPRLKLCSANTVARAAVLIDEALQNVLTKSVLPMALGHTDLEEVDVPVTVPFTLYSATTDGWTSNGTPFLGVTLHFISPDWKMQTHSLSLRYFEPPHTGKRYEELFGALLEENGLHEGCLGACTTDSASSMILFMDLAQFVHMRCFAHSLHNGVKADTLGANDILEPPFRLAKFFTSIATTRNKIADDKAAAMNLPLLRPVFPVVTRWSSSLAMLARHNLRWPVISQLDPKQLKITDADAAKEYKEVHSKCKNESSLFVAVQEMLEPVAEWTNRLQASSSPTISLLFEAKSSILTALKPEASDSSDAAAFRALLHDSLSERMNDDFVPAAYPSASALKTEQGRKTAVRFKMVNTATLLDVRTAAAHLPTLLSHFDMLVDYVANSHVLWQRAAIVPPVQAAPADAAGAGGGGGVLAALKAKTSAAAAVSPVEMAKAGVTAELHLYADAVTAATKGLQAHERLALDPLEWWRTNESKYPHLAHVARSLLAIQATSAASERLFSVAGFSADGTRNRVSPDTLELAVLVRSAIQNGIDLREEVRRLQNAKATTANAKRSASMKAVRAAKKAKSGESDGSSNSSSDAAAAHMEEEEEGELEAEVALAAKVATLLADGDDEL